MENSSNKEVFEQILRRISIQAFDALLHCGVRDIEGLLHLTEDALRQTGTSPRIATQLMDVKRKLCAQGEESSDNNNVRINLSTGNDLPDVQMCKCEGLLRPETSIPADLMERLSTRAQNFLVREKVLTCERLLGLNEKDLFNFEKIGKKTVDELKRLQGKIIHILPDAQRASVSVDCQSDGLQPAALVSPGVVSSVYHPGNSGYSASWPADWSLLSRTLPELFQVSLEKNNGSNYNELTTIGTLGFSPYDTARLAKMVVFPEDSAENLFAMSIGYLLQSGISDDAFSIILDHLARISGRSSWAQLPNLSANLSDVAIYADIPIGLIEDQLVTHFSYPDIIATNANKPAAITWGELERITERMAIERLGFTIRGIETIKYLWSLKDQAIGIHNAISKGLPAEAYRSFEQLTDAFVNSVVKKKHDSAVLKGRLGFLEGKKWTLEEVGQRENLSRERIRQIEKKLMQVLQKPRTQERLFRLWLTVDEILTSGGGVCCASEIAESLTNRWKWPTPPSDEALALFLSLSVSYEVIWESPIRIILPKQKCVGCAEIGSVLTKAVESQPNWTLPFEKADAVMRYFCHSRACVEAIKISRFSKGFLHFLDDTIEEIVADETACYTQYAWAQKHGKHGTRTLLVETILRKAGCPMHFTEVQAEVNKDRPVHGQLSERNIYGYIARSSDLLLWDRGTYIHRDYFSIPYDLIAKIENEIVFRLQDDIPYLSVSGIFDFHKDELIENGVPTESALYTCLKESNNNQLAYPDYPYQEKWC